MLNAYRSTNHSTATPITTITIIFGFCLTVQCFPSYTKLRCIPTTELISLFMILFVWHYILHILSW